LELEVLRKDFYKSDTIMVARDLLGKFLVRNVNNKLLIAKIVETEAYLGKKDPAAHSFIGKTKRNKAMFGEPGCAYIYHIHQQYCFNVVTQALGVPHGVLVRAAEPIKGLGFMKKQRQKTKKDVGKKDLLSGPGKLTQAMLIDMSFYGVDLTATRSSLKVCGGKDESIVVKATKRIGISKAKEEKLRFVIEGSNYLSKSVVN
jgi:DNA-3-methyladenine glycosylase